MVTTGQTAQQLAEVIAGPGVVVSNASITGDPTAIGAFAGGANNPGLGINSGVIMSSGSVLDASQPNTSFSSTSFNLPGDPFLEAQANEQSNDAVILEFDFVPNADFVTFNYVFGSEEYPEWTCSFNDIFAFTIQGITVPSPQTNIALIPGSNIPVAINTVSDDVGCMIQSCGQSNIQYYVNNTAGPASQYVVYDGLTVLMAAEATVICGETYRLRLMLSDGGDWSYDSGCFIEENSLTTGSIVVEAATATADSTAYEGCNEATITLTLNGPPLAQDFPVPIWISNSTAEMGVDYNNITTLNAADSTMIIPAGQNTVQFTITPVNDNIPEGPEYIEFIVITSTCGLTDTFRIYINDLEPLATLTSNDTTICGGNAILWCEATGGGGVYSFTWDNGFGTSDTIYPSPTQTTVYHVVVEDNCNSSPAIDSVTVTLDGGPVPNAGPDVVVCIGGSTLLNATSDTPGSTFEWSPGVGLSDSTIHNPMCSPIQNTEYIVTVTRPDGCSNDDTVMVTLSPPPTGLFSLPAMACVGEPVVVEYTGNASSSAQFNWNFSGGEVLNGSGGGPISAIWNDSGIDTVQLLVSWNGCVSPVESNLIEIIGAPPVDAGPDISICSDELGVIGFAPLAGHTYLWSPSNGITDPTESLTTVQLTNSSHEIEVFELGLMAIDDGCKGYDTVNVTVFPKPTAEFIIPDGMCFNVNSFDLMANGYFGPNATFEWDFGPVGYPSSSTQANPLGVIFNEPGPQEVTLTVTDNTCVSLPFTGTIEVFEMPVADFDVLPKEGCEPLWVQFEDESYNGNSSLYHLWDFGNGASSTDQDPSSVYSQGLYNVSLRVVTSHGCADEVTKEDVVEAFQKPNALFSIEPSVTNILDPTVTVTNLADSVVGSEFVFHPNPLAVNSMEMSYEYPDTGLYEVTQIVTTINGCKDTISGEVRIDPYYTLFIPQAFSPDNNGINEVWVPQGQSIASFQMTIYNRWDEELFFSASLDSGWDGTYKGMPVKQGVYVYSIETIDALGEPHVYRGSFSLFR